MRCSGHLKLNLTSTSAMRTFLKSCVIVASSTVLLSGDLSAKCFVWGTVSLLRSDAEPEPLLNAFGTMASGHWGTCHLSGSDSIQINVFFDCPQSIWVTRDEVLVMDTANLLDLQLTYAIDGFYTIHIEEWSIEWMGASFQLDHSTSIAPFTLPMAAMLDGPFEVGPMLMRDDLRMNGLVPLQEPYSSMGYTIIAGAGVSIPNSMLSDTSSSALTIVDWVVVELRSEDDPNTVVYSTVGLIGRTGWIRAADGYHLTVNVPPGDYHVVVRHRNHQSIMTSNPVQFRAFNRQVDFRSVYLQCWGTDSRKEHPELGAMSPYYLCMRAGNATGLDNGSISYIGAQNDRDAILQRLTSQPNITVTGYYNEDLDLDGSVRYTGAANDRDIVLQSIGGTAPHAVRWEQLP